MTIQSLTQAQQAEVDRWLFEPLHWAKTFGGADFDPWSGQAQLWVEYGKLVNAKLRRYSSQLNVRQGLPPLDMTEEEQTYANKMGISVMAGQGLGKERTIALMGLHYLFILKAFKPKGVCTAPAGPTLHSTLWPEFGKVIDSSPALAALFEKQANRIYLKEDTKRGEYSRIEPRTIQQNSSEDEQAVVLAGIHALGVFYMVTEASGVQNAVFKPLEGGLTDPLSLIMLIFNPTRRDGFAAESHTKNRKDWVCLQWSGRTLKKEKAVNPGRFLWFNEQAQDVLIRKFGEDSDFVRIRVDGLPPKAASDALIHYDAAMQATEREVDVMPYDPLSIGVDVGGDGDGGDPSVVTIMRGPKVIRQDVHRVKLARLSDLVVEALTEERTSMPNDAQAVVCVDYGGVGRAVYEDLTSRHLVANIYKVDVAEAPIRDTEFHRLRDELWWELREAFMDSREIAMPYLDDLIGQLTSIKWAEVALNGKTRIKVQGKGSSSGIPGVKPLLHSPNEADSLCLAWRGYRRYCSRVPLTYRRRRQALYRRQVSWKGV